MQQRDRLSDEEAAAVFRRAAELDVHTVGSGEFDLDAIEEIGGRAGLSPQAIRQAVAELRAGSLPATVAPQQRRDLLPAAVTVDRSVPGSAPALLQRIEVALRRQCLDQVRFGQHNVWVPKKGILADLQRGFDFTGRLRFKDVTRLAVSVAEAEGTARSHVRIVAELKSYYRPLAAAAVAVPLVGGVAWALAALGGADTTPVLLELLPAAGGAGVAAGGWASVRAALQRRRLAVSESLHGLLDQLEHGR